MKKLIIALIFSLFVAGYFHREQIDFSKLSFNQPAQQAPKKIIVTAIKERVTNVEPEVRNEIYYLPNEKEPFTGKYVKFHQNGIKEVDANYKDGKRTRFISWRENGKKLEETNFVNGKINVSKVYLDEDGKLISEHIYKNGEIYSSVQYENKEKVMETNYKDGKPNGLSAWRNKNSDKIVEINYKDGKQNGLSTVQFENGDKVESTHENGKKVNVYTYVNGNKYDEKINKGRQETNTTMQEIISRCRKQMGEYGAAMVKACVDQDIEAEKALQKY
jgi:antitoxin component YwqK of YwqJK toxin-antitoxin module